jgi:hypothetical protein
MPSMEHGVMAGKPGWTDADHERALLDPETVFGTPEALLERTELTPDQKVEILRSWEYDERENSVAVEEGMPGAAPELLRRILLALDRLTDGSDVSLTSPAKHHGIPDTGARKD